MCVCQVRPPQVPLPHTQKTDEATDRTPRHSPQAWKDELCGPFPKSTIKCASNQLFTNQQDAECGRGWWGIPSALLCESNTDVQTFHSLVQKSLADLAHKCGYNSPEPNTRKSDPTLCERVDAPEPNWVHSRNGEMFSQWKFYQSNSLH